MRDHLPRPLTGCCCSAAALLLQVHDELIFEVETPWAPAVGALVREAMVKLPPTPRTRLLPVATRGLAISRERETILERQVHFQSSD